MEQDKVKETKENRELDPKEVEVRDNFSIRLVEARKRIPYMTQKKLADQIGTNNSHISNLEKGKQLPNLVTAVRIAEKTRSSLDWLCGLTDTFEELTEQEEKEEKVDFWNAVPITQALLIILSHFQPNIETDRDEDDNLQIRLVFKDSGVIIKKKMNILYDFIRGYKPIQVLESTGGEYAEIIDDIAIKLVKKFEGQL